MAWRCLGKKNATTAIGTGTGIGIGIMKQHPPSPFALSFSNNNYSHIHTKNLVVDNIKSLVETLGCVLSSRRTISHHHHHHHHRSRNYNHHHHLSNGKAELNRDLFIRLWALHNDDIRSSKKKAKNTPSKPQYYSSKTEFPVKQPPPTESVTGFLKPTSSLEAQVAPLLARSNLLITRDIEWANLVFGFEQENRYAIMDVCYPQAPVGFIREQSNIIARQLLRTRRPFVAYITDALGNVLFTVRRPFWWITSSIYAEIDGKEVGVVHRHWHLWRRIYDLYLGNKQFAVVENPGLWNWTFTLKDIDGNVLAEIDRNWRGFGFELFTDAGQYVIRFGNTDPTSKTGPASQIQELEVARPLTLSERAVAVALAISLDNDYFSMRGGWAIPFIAVTE